MYVPMSTPVTKGQTIRLDIGSTSRPELRGLPSPIEAVVVRVDRNKLLDLGHLVVGVQFNREAAPQA